MKPERSEAAVLLQQVGEVQFGQKVRVKKVRAHRVAVARVALMLHDDGGVWERTITVVDAPDEARSGLEGSVGDACGRPVPLAELSPVLRAQIDRAVEEQRALGYAQVVIARVTVHEEDVREVRYRAAGRGTVTAYLGTAPPRVVGFDAGRGLSALATARRMDPRRHVPASVRSQLGAALVVIGWFAYLAWTVYRELY